MRIAVDILRKFIELPSDVRAVRELFDDLGLEVKRQEETALGQVFTLELLANRGDHHCYAGVAREISGRTGGSVHLPTVALLEAGRSPIPLAIESPLCLVYTATLLERSAPAETLDGAERDLLVASGLKSIDAAVDATNLSNLEFGQPTHAFDADCIAGGIIVRTSRTGERAWPLFTPEPVVLSEGTLVIADAEKILAIAGVIGCEESKTTPSTTRLLLESATFDPVSVRKASRALGIHTDSSARFERGGDPSLPLVGAGRVVSLLERHGWRRVGTTGVLGAWQDPRRQIAVNIRELASFLEYPLTDEEFRSRLCRYGFVVSGAGEPILVQVPPHRLWDIEFPADIAEELAKSIGYNATPSHLPPVDKGALLSPAEVARRKVDNVLVGLGFYEVFTDGFYGGETRERMGISQDHRLWPHVETQNSLERGYSLLKNNCIAQAVETVAENLRHQQRRTMAYEWTRTFHPKPDADNGVCTEYKVLWLIACGASRTPTWAEDPPAADIYYLKGIVRELAVELGIPLDIAAPDPELPLADVLHPSRQALVVLGGKIVGVLGEIHPRVVSAFRIKRERPVYMEISASALSSPSTPKRFVAPPETPPVSRALAFTLPHRVTAGEIAEHLEAVGPKGLKRVEVTDRFDHEEAGSPVRTITFTLAFQHDADRTLTSDELNEATEALIRAVTERFGERGVKLRTSEPRSS